MVKKLYFVMSIVILLLGVTPASAQGPITPQHSDPNWQASYWNNTTLDGTPVLQRKESNIAHDWAYASPDASIQADYFSARWTRYIDVTPGTYRFTVTSDDGARLWVDGDLIIDQWTEHPATTYTVDHALDAGHHLVKVEYFEKTGLASINVAWQLKGTPPTITHWRGEYFNNVTLSGAPALVRDDVAIAFDWQGGSPAPDVVNADHFSVRWTRTQTLDAGTYHFSLTVDDGARLWVNGHLLVDAWLDQAATTYTGDIYLPGGPVTLELQYYERTGSAVAQLTWSSDTTPSPPPAGTVIVDDGDAGFIQGGATGGWRYVAEGYDGRLIWTYNNNTWRENYNWARWYPELQARNYEVFVYIPERYTTTGQARYWISHAGGYTLKVVDQSGNGDRWVSLGTYRFRGNGDDYVSLADITYETYRTRLIAFDAVKWEPR